MVPTTSPLLRLSSSSRASLLDASLSGRLARIGGPVYPVLIGAFLIALAVPCLVRQPGDWEHVYVEAGRRLRTGQDIFEWGIPGYGYVYPPFGALMAMPFSFLPPWTGKAAWALANMLAAAAHPLVDGDGHGNGPPGVDRFVTGAGSTLHVRGTV